MASSSTPIKKTYEGPRQTFDHPQLGNISGRIVDSSHFPDNSAVQFRSIPYATVPKRFCPSVPLADIPESFDDRPPRDYTSFGTACPQLGARHPAWSSPYGGALEDDIGMVFEENTCLTMTISVPQAHLEQGDAKSSLPVMVYVHGGGASDGVAHVDGLHSNAPLASYSASISQPVIIVNVGYRLNWFGNLVCQDLLDEFSEERGSPQGPFNLSMQDQRNAFFWIQKFIGGFGGDSNNITAFGESAGSTFLSYHICSSSERLFDRAILQSGLPFGDLPLKTKEQEYQDLLKHLNINKTTGKDRLKALRAVDADELVKCPGSHLTPYVGPVPGVAPEDNVFSRGPATLTNFAELIATCEWLGDLVIGDDFWEGQLFLLGVHALSQEKFQETIKAVFPQPEGEALLKAYDLPSSGTEDMNRALIPLSHFFGDMAFSSQYQILAETLLKHVGKAKRQVFRYSFALSNPFPGTLFSFSPGHHFVEILYVFLTLLDRYPNRRDSWAAKQAKETARKWIAFANGQRPWEPYATSNTTSIEDTQIAICDDLRGWTTRTTKEDDQISRDDPWGERRYHGWKAFEAAFNSLRTDGESLEDWNRKVTTVRLKLLELILGAGGIVRVPGPDAYA